MYEGFERWAKEKRISQDERDNNPQVVLRWIRELAGYSIQDPHEALAVAWTEYKLSPKPSRAAKILGKMLDDAYDEKYRPMEVSR